MVRGRARVHEERRRAAGFVEAASSSIAQNPSAVWREVPLNITVGVDGDHPPTALALLPATPNPMHDRGAIAFDVPHAMRISVGLFDLQGRKIRTMLADQTVVTGRHEIPFTRAGLAAGVYLCRLTATELFGGRRSNIVRVQRLIVD